MITITPAAREQILSLMKQEPRSDLALRLGVRGRGPGGFQYRLSFVTPDDRKPTDQAVDAGGFMVLVDADSFPSLDGATVDFVQERHESGFKIDNPNPLWSDPTALAVSRVIEEEINPAVASHGGVVTLLDVREDVVYIALGGGCQGCGMVDVTLKQGVEVLIKRAVPTIREVIDTTDHAEGRNPYYHAGHGGGSAVRS